MLSINATSPGAADALDDVCKSPAVQKELALVTGWKNTFEILPCEYIQVIQMAVLSLEKGGADVGNSCGAGLAVWYFSR